EHQPYPHAGSDRQEREVVDSTRDAEPTLAERREVDVVLEHHRVAEPRPDLVAERATLETGHVARLPERPGRGFDDAGNPDDDSVDAVVGDSGRLGQRAVERQTRTTTAWQQSLLECSADRKNRRLDSRHAA